MSVTSLSLDPRFSDSNLSDESFGPRPTITEEEYDFDMGHHRIERISEEDATVINESDQGTFIECINFLFYKLRGDYFDCFTANRSSKASQQART